MLLTIVFIEKVKTKWGKVESSTHIRQRSQNILKKLSGIIGPAREATMPFETWNCLFTDEIF